MADYGIDEKGTLRDFNGWLEQVCQPHNIEITASLKPELLQTLDEWETSRVKVRLPMLRLMSARLIANMVKGIVKYGKQQQDRDLLYWLNHGIDDAADTLNYFYLAKAQAMKAGHIPWEEGYVY